MRIAVHDYAGHPFQFEMSRALARRGHVVRHFFFADDPGPKGDTARRPDDPADFSVAPISIRLAYSKERFVRRLLGDLLYGREAARQIRRFRPDVVISGNTPLDTQRALQRSARRSGSRFVFWVQDFYGLAIERLLAGRWRGAGSAIAAWYRRMETRLLRESDGTVLISPGFAQFLPPGLGNVRVIRNWGALDLISPGPRDTAWRERHGLAGKFVFMYTGTLALKHDPNLLLALADAFAGNEEVAIVVVGTGVNADTLRAAQQAAPRENLVLLPLQPAAELPEVLASADVLVALLESDAGAFSVPSKLLNYLCAGRPVLLSAPPQNLSAEVLAESGGGLAVAAGSKAAFVDAANRLFADQAGCAAMGASGRAYAERNFAIDEIARRFELVLEAQPAAAAEMVGKMAW